MQINGYIIIKRRCISFISIFIYSNSYGDQQKTANGFQERIAEPEKSHVNTSLDIFYFREL